MMKKQRLASLKVEEFCCPSQELKELESSLEVIDAEVLPPLSEKLPFPEKCSSLSYHKKIREPETALLAAVLNLSYYDLTRSSAGEVAYRDALKWFLGDFPYSGEYDNHLFSFNTICGYLNLDAKSIRHRIKELHLHVN